MSLSPWFRPKDLRNVVSRNGASSSTPARFMYTLVSLSMLLTMSRFCEGRRFGRPVHGTRTLQSRQCFWTVVNRSEVRATNPRLLDRYGLPFFYEHPTLIYDRGRYRVWHSDFTLPTYNGLILEYAGMPDVPDYAASNRYKRRAYAVNGISALFIYPEYLTGSMWPDMVFARIETTARLAPLRTKYDGTKPVDHGEGPR